MTLSEFKAWFEGFTESMEGAPTEAQFEKIKAKVKEINGAPISQTIFVERYRDIWRGPYTWPYISWSAGAAGQAPASLMSVAGAAPESARYSAGDNQTAEWDSHAAMRAAGRLEASA